MSYTAPLKNIAKVATPQGFEDGRHALAANPF